MNKSSIKSKAKRLLLKSLDTLPSQAGYSLYHFVQNILGESLEVKVEANARSYSILKDIFEKNDFSINNRTILEIGSGWMPLMPYQFKVEGDCKRVYTYDINDHYQNKYIDELNAHYRKLGKLNFDVSKEGLHLPDFIQYHPHANVITADLPESVDLIFSRFVLEHVTPADLKAMHERFRAQYGKNVYIIHLISPSDHRAFSDASLSHYDFLRYSQKEWNRIQTKFDYHNRLRLPQYVEIFEKAGMEIVHLEHDFAEPGTKKHNLFKQVPIHDDFKKFTEVELTAGSINVLLRPKALK
jgi:hypothetical protein